MKPRKLDTLPAVTAALILTCAALSAGSAQASRTPPAHHDSAPSAQSAPDLKAGGPSQELLKGIFEKSTQELEQARNLMSQGRYGDAMLAAKKIVDRVSVINPKGNFSTHIPVSGILTDDDLQKSFNQLLDRQQEALAEAVTAFKGGYFLDILNLYKRAKLTYVEAFYKKMKGQLMQVDIDMMRQSLIDVYAISVLVKDDKASDSYLLFDSDIANPDEQYMFNRELISTAVSIRELHLTENSFSAAVDADMERRLNDHKAGLSRTVPKEINICYCYHYGDDIWQLREKDGQYYLGEFSDKNSCVSAERLNVNRGKCSDGADL